MERAREVHILRLGIYERREIFWIPLFVVQANSLHVKITCVLSQVVVLNSSVIFIPQ